MKAPDLAIRACGLRKTFRREKGELVQALDGVSLEAHQGALTALVGPDGAGKTTLIRLMAGLMAPDEGMLEVLGLNVVVQPQQIQDRLGYMPQRFGLYEDLSVEENLDLYADLHGVSPAHRHEQYPKLMEMTALGAFRDRLAGKLSGGMKQKLGLACTLIGKPALLLLDEPTVGVDPLSRRDLWKIILHLVRDQALTVVLSTSYLDEAERCDNVVVLYTGKTLAQGRPGAISNFARARSFVADPPNGCTARWLQARLLSDPAIVDAIPEAGRVRFVCSNTGSSANANAVLAGTRMMAVEPRFEDGFMILLRGSAAQQRGEQVSFMHQREEPGNEVIVEVTDLVRKFGDFTAVDRIGFEVHRGEIFGLLGPNGAGKTTTFRMLCGLLPATKGVLRISGMDLRFSRALARQRIGYVAQKFSLYGQLTVAENLEFFASAYGLRGSSKRRRIEWALEQFGLEPFEQLAAGQLPGGYRQRLAMAAALLHQPEILFLDEPTSGADPLARREFWRRVTALAEQSVTVIVTTHFMEEAEYCDRLVIMDQGRILAQGTPAGIRSLARAEQGREPTMEDAFIAIVEQARKHSDEMAEQGAACV
jgi:ABC-2 type transport system ATP-binding protein